MRASVIQDAEGNTVGFVAFVLDVSDRLRVENDLRKSERMLADAQRIAHVGTWDWNAETEVLSWSDEVYKLFGTEPKSYTPSYRSFNEYVHTDDKVAVNEFLRSIPILKRRVSIDYRVIRADDGMERFIQGQAEPFYGDDGEFLGNTGTVTDVTDRIHAQQMLQQAHDELERRVEMRTHELKTTLQTVVEGVINIDHEGTIEAFNSSAEKVFGYGSAEVIGKNVTLLMSANDAKHHHSYLLQYLATGAAKVIDTDREVTGKRKDGSTFPMWLGIGEMQIAGARKFVGTIQDITLRKAVEKDLIQAKDEAEHSNRAKSEFLSSMSHELRTSMNAVLGYTQLMEIDVDSPLADHQQTYVSEILRAGVHMVELIDSVLDLESVERGNLNLNIEKCSVVPIVKQCPTLVSTEAEENNIKIVSQLPRDESPIVAVDQLRLRQAILNLCPTELSTIEKMAR
jgi:PAS domain S-box-containing protein